jgi:hypothetical protein
MLCSMRHLEVHVIETEHDIDLALQAGLVTAGQLSHSECSDCADLVGHAGESFSPFVVVIDEYDFDWAVCSDCASSVITPPSAYPFEETGYSETFDEDDFETF